MARGEQRKRQRFPGLLVGIVLATLVTLLLLDLYAWKQSRQAEDKTPQRPVTARNDNQGAQSPDTPAAGRYQGWLTYNNAAYGISFKYPPEWRVEEAAAVRTSTPPYPTRQEYAITLKRSGATKYDQTVSIEVLGQPLAEVAAVYDSQFAQAPDNETTRTDNPLKGVKSVQYRVNSTAETKLYLFAVGQKAYLVSSINEESNLQADASYWATFDKVFESLQLALSTP